MQGWNNDNYLMLFDDRKEAEVMHDRYGIATVFPEYELVGLTGWDDFILRDPCSQLFTVPTIPLLRELLRPIKYHIDTSKVQPDPRFADRFKWHVQPIVFGGDPHSPQNIVWLSVDQHAEAVKWWNNKYRELKCA